MTDAETVVRKFEDHRHAALRRKIALVCHAVRWLTVGYSAVRRLGLHDHWSNADRVQRAFRNFYKVDIAGVALAMARRRSGFRPRLASCSQFCAGTSGCLFGRYLEGDIFQRAARLCSSGLACSVSSRSPSTSRCGPVTVLLMTAHVADHRRLQARFRAHGGRALHRHLARLRRARHDLPLGCGTCRRKRADRVAMPIIVNLDVMLAKRKMRSRELAERIGIAEQNVSLLKSGKVKGVRFDTLEKDLRDPRDASRATSSNTSPTKRRNRPPG